ncbi:MAG TPA: hypothetical protein VGF48_04725 [Thermoanaerobaculia bacterium]|jgi:hypothetical protein
MISKSDWQAAAREAAAADRQRHGEPPTAEDVLAYMNGELAEEDAERVRAGLVAHPELARILVDPLPEEGDLSEDVLKRQWRRLRDRVHAPQKIAAMTRKQRGNSYFAIAASVVICVLGVWLVQSKMQERSLQQRLREPRVASERTTLRSADRRGPSDGGAILSAASEGHLLRASMIDPPQYPEYRLDLVDVNAPARRAVWSRGGLARPADDTFELLVPRGFLAVGRYRLEVYGVRGAESERIAAYNVQIVP